MKPLLQSQISGYLQHMIIGKCTISPTDILVQIASFKIKGCTKPVTHGQVQAVLVEEFSIYISCITNVYKDFILQSSKYSFGKCWFWLKWNHIPKKIAEAVCINCPI